MAALTQTSLVVPSVGTATVNTLTASDTLTYTSGASQLLELDNQTGGSLTVVIKGSAPSASFAVHGTTIDFSAGLSVTVAAGAKKFVNLDKIPKFLEGTGTVTLTGATGLKVTCYTQQ